METTDDGLLTLISEVYGAIEIWSERNPRCTERASRAADILRLLLATVGQM